MLCQLTSVSDGVESTTGQSSDRPACAGVVRFDRAGADLLDIRPGASEPGTRLTEHRAGYPAVADRRMGKRRVAGRAERVSLEPLAADGTA